MQQKDTTQLEKEGSVLVDPLRAMAHEMTERAVHRSKK